MNRNQMDARRKNQIPTNGFTLMELLIVMAVIAILSLLAIASIGSYTKRANSLSAVNSLHVIVSAQTSYSSDYPSLGYACSLPALGGDPKSGPPSAAAAQLLPEDLVSGLKQGYMFTITCGDEVTSGSTTRHNSFTVVAKPQTVGKTGDRTYCSDQDGHIKFDPAGGNECTQNLQ
jgi:type IV pilus assembly protein PilA